MSDDSNSPDCGGKLPEGMSVGALIRAAADQELTDAQIAEFEALCAERDCTQDRVKFEQTLKDCCGRVMNDQPRCPDALRNKVMALAEAGGDVGVAAAESKVEAMAEQTRSVSFWRRSPGMLAAAAVLALFAGVMIFQSVSLPTGPVPAGWTQQQVSNRDRIARFVASEHKRCCRSDRASEAKLVIRDIDEARAYFASELGVGSVDVSSDEAPDGEISFWGAGDCHVPASDGSGHFRFDATTPGGDELRLSLFVVNDQQQMPMVEGVTYRVDSSACDKAGVRLFTWKQAGVVYLLVTEAAEDYCSTVRDTLHAPGDVRSF